MVLLQAYSYGIFIGHFNNFWHLIWNNCFIASLKQLFLFTAKICATSKFFSCMIVLFLKKYKINCKILLPISLFKNSTTTTYYNQLHNYLFLNTTLQSDYYDLKTSKMYFQAKHQPTLTSTVRISKTRPPIYEKNLRKTFKNR